MCEQRYIGETGRFKRNRNWEHFKSARDHTEHTAVGKHFKLSHPYMPTPEQPFKFTVRKTCRDFVDRQLWQSVLIKRENPEMNKQLSENRVEGEWEKNNWKLL